MIWPENTHLEPIVEEAEHQSRMCYLAQLVVRKPFGQDEMPLETQNVISLSCSLGRGIVDAVFIYEPDSPFIKLDFVAEEADRAKAFGAIIEAVLYELDTNDFDLSELACEAGQWVDKDELISDQSNEPELDLDIRNGRYTYHDVSMIFDRTVTMMTNSDESSF